MRIKSILKRVIGVRNQNAEYLRKKGAHIGEKFSNFGIVDEGHAYLFSAGNNVTLAAGCRILLHDASTQFQLGYSRVGRVDIGDEVFVGADSIVLPNIRIGSRCIIGAGSVVTHDVLDNTVVAGNPAKTICTYDEYIDKCKKMFSNAPVFDKYWTDKTMAEKEEERKKLSNGICGFDK